MVLIPFLNPMGMQRSLDQNRMTLLTDVTYNNKPLSEDMKPQFASKTDVALLKPSGQTRSQL